MGRKYSEEMKWANGVRGKASYRVRARNDLSEGVKSELMLE